MVEEKKVNGKRNKGKKMQSSHFSHFREANRTMVDKFYPHFTEGQKMLLLWQAFQN